MTNQPPIKTKFVNGILWGIIEKFASLFTGFIITLVLARILTPADYELVNMIYIFTVLGTVLLDGGFGQAIIQRKSLTDGDISSVFYINLAMSLIIYIVLYNCAHFIADFYSQPSLVEISRVVFITIPINALSVIQHTLLTKELKVKELTYVSILSSLISGCVGIILAYNHYGVWALVFQSVSYQFVRSIALWRFSTWRPILQFNITFIKDIWGFSMNLLGVFTLASIFQNIYTLMIGRLYNVNEVGYYNQAFRVQSVAVAAIMSSVQRVTFPTFSKFQDNLDELRNVYKRVTIIMMSIYFPLMLCLVIIGKDLFHVLLTDKWLPSVPMFCILCVAESLFPLNNMNSAILKAVGKGREYFILNIVNYIILSISILLTFKFSIIILLVGYAVSAFVRSLISMIVCGRVINYSLINQVADLLPIIFITSITCGVVYATTLLSIQPILRLIISVLVGTTVFIGINVVVKSKLYNEMLSLIKKR